MFREAGGYLAGLPIALYMRNTIDWLWISHVLYEHYPREANRGAPLLVSLARQTSAGFWYDEPPVSFIQTTLGDVTITANYFLCFIIE
jgi:hypothetical protein